MRLKEDDKGRARILLKHCRICHHLMQSQLSRASSCLHYLCVFAGLPQGSRSNKDMTVPNHETWENWEGGIAQCSNCFASRVTSSLTIQKGMIKVVQLGARTHTCVYVYIYIERERERETYAYSWKQIHIDVYVCI